jgi:hypothetical protein
VTDPEELAAPATSGFRGVTFPEQGSFRITNFSVDFSGDEVALGSNSTYEVRTDIWQHWYDIARTHTGHARDARDRNPGLDDPAGFGSAVVDEMRLAIVAVTAAAFSLEAFHTSVLQHLPGVHIHADSADGRVHQTLLRAFQLSNKQSKETRNDLRQLFRLRDYGVHPKAAWAVPALHEAFHNAMDPKYVTFSVENAEATTRFAHELLGYCLQHPRQKHPELVAWCDAMKQHISKDEGGETVATDT